MREDPDNLDGCDVVLREAAWISDDQLAYLCLFAGVPETDREIVERFWLTLFPPQQHLTELAKLVIAREFRAQFPPRRSSELWLADAARQWGLTVTEVNGWQSRSAGSFDPRGGVMHHTAGPSAGGDMPSLETIINGRPDLSGPLANYGLGRSGTVYVVAAGRANHAGSGGWNGLSGNSSVIGIEAENDGYQDWPDVQLDAYVTLAAACCAAKNISPDNWCRHHEWRSEKPDPHDIDGPLGRERIAERLAQGPTPRTEDDEMNFLLMVDSRGTQRLVSNAGMCAVVTTGADSAALKKALSIDVTELSDGTYSNIVNSCEAMGQ